MNTVTKKKLTVMFDVDVYKALREKVGERGIGSFLSNLARSHVVVSSLDSQYKEMSLDSAREQDIKEWLESDLEVSNAENTWQF
jgi:hypothetical protein